MAANEAVMPRSSLRACDEPLEPREDRFADDRDWKKAWDAVLTRLNASLE
jgi:hypothetical protein